MFGVFSQHSAFAELTCYATALFYNPNSFYVNRHKTLTNGNVWMLISVFIIKFLIYLLHDYRLLTELNVINLFTFFPMLFI